MKRLIVGVLCCGLLAIFVCLLARFDFHTRWRNLRDGMTQQEVKQALGSPTWTGTTMVIGVGNQPITRWQYERGLSTYLVDFDYIGPVGAPVVYRTERLRQEWSWRLWDHARVRY